VADTSWVQVVAVVAGADATAVDGMAIAVRTTATRIVLMVFLSLLASPIQSLADAALGKHERRDAARRLAGGVGPFHHDQMRSDVSAVR
jgi:hypothetical protein